MRPEPQSCGTSRNRWGTRQCSSEAPGVTKHTNVLVVGYQDARRLRPGEALSDKARKARDLREQGRLFRICSRAGVALPRSPSASRSCRDDNEVPRRVTAARDLPSSMASPFRRSRMLLRTDALDMTPLPPEHPLQVGLQDPGRCLRRASTDPSRASVVLSREEPRSARRCVKGQVRTSDAKWHHVGARPAGQGILGAVQLLPDMVCLALSSVALVLPVSARLVRPDELRDLLA